jgi:hypothetical protein
MMTNPRCLMGDDATSERRRRRYDDCPLDITMDLERRHLCTCLGFPRYVTVGNGELRRFCRFFGISSRNQSRDVVSQPLPLLRIREPTSACRHPDQSRPVQEPRIRGRCGSVWPGNPVREAGRAMVKGGGPQPTGAALSHCIGCMLAKAEGVLSAAAGQVSAVTGLERCGEGRARLAT